MIKPNKYSQAVLELTLAGIIWGASFTLVRWALIDFSATTLIFWRFVIAFLVGEAIHYFANRKLFKNSWSDARLALLAGVSLGLALFLQTFGLNYTTATNSGFITSLYVVLIPMIAALFFKQKIKMHHIVLSLVAFTGMGFLLDLKNFTANIGDLLTLGAAFTSAFQIIFIGKAAKHAKSAFRYNNYQTFWSCITILPFLVIEVRGKNINLWPENPQMLSIMSMVALALFVSILAFYLQVRAQQTLSTTTSSMLCLLEGPFAFIFAAYFLSESLQGAQLFGALVILLSCVLSVYMDRPKT
ncbi:MAG: DMT family transporter [Bdellovibrionota bacterium]